jgi:dCTP deaminase
LSILSDREIKQLVKIDPFVPAQKRPGKISYGVSSYGYDARVGTIFKIFTNVSLDGRLGVVDPKNFGDTLFHTVETDDHIIIPPNSFALAETVEYFEIPRDILVVCVGKSTYARCGLIVNVTPLEPEWKGKVTLEISNTTPLPAKVYANEGIAQFLFFKASQLCEISYADKNGKYQDQKGLTLPTVDGDEA